jgi:hypothetical protein
MGGRSDGIASASRARKFAYFSSSSQSDMRYHAQIAANPALLPSNALLIRLYPPGQTYYLPQATHSRSSSRPPSPTGGHASDPEADTSKPRGGSGHSITPRTPHVRTLFQTEEQEPSDYLARGRGRHLREPAKTASWNDLVKCVHLAIVL